jgi:FixJ family two-component response regulator
MMRNEALVVIVDDDVSVRESLPDLVRQLGYAARAFASAEEFLASGVISSAACLILDIGMPGMSGPDLRRELVRRGYNTPTIFITGRSDHSIPPGLIQERDSACLFKPFGEEDMRMALDMVLQEDR